MFELSSSSLLVPELSTIARVSYRSQSVELPIFLLHFDIELIDTLKGELISLDENPNRLVHELVGDLKGLRGHGS